MFKLIDLPYALDALEPVISQQTLEFHHGKHLQTYVDNLNKLIAGTDFEGKPLEEIVRHSGLDPESRAVFNNAGQTLNHNLYFTQFSPAPHSGLDSHDPHSGLDPESPLAKRIVNQWGTIDVFKSEFEAKGVGLFGSGWVWLAAKENGELAILQCPGADNPVAHGLKPLLTFDVWEHAYYLDYQNRRAAHLNALWLIVNWAEIEKRYTK